MTGVDRVPVIFLQDDLTGVLEDLPFRRHEKHGKSLFTPNVSWADIWLVERKQDPTFWTGTIRDGQLFLDQAKKGSRVAPRQGTQTRASLLLTGHYKIWVDAWLRPGEEVYAGDRFTKTDCFDEDDDACRWTPPAIPHRRHWQDIHVRRPGSGQVAQLKVKSRRFHWLYRLSRILFTLEKLLEVRERNAVRVARARDQVVYLQTFLALMMESNTNSLQVPMLKAMGRRGSVPQNPDDWPNWRKLREMQARLENVFVASENFIRWGVGGNDAVVEEHQHLNNIAHLLWRLVNEPDFQEDVAAWEPTYAIQHRSLVARIPAVLNRVPLALEGFQPDVRTGDLRATGVSLHYGEEFASRFGRPFLDRLAAGAVSWMQAAGSSQGDPAGSAGGASRGKRGVEVKWLDSTRKYCWAMMNSLSVFVGRKPADFSKMLDALKRADLNLFYAAEREIEKYRALGRSDVVQRLIRNRTMNMADDARWKSALGWSEYDEFQELQKEIQAARGGQPERVADALKRGNPAALYMLDGFEIFVKVLVARAAWQAFRDEAAKAAGGGLRRGSAQADAWIRSMDAAATILKSTAFKSLLKWTFSHASPGALGSVEALLDKGDLAGRWGSFAVDLYAAWTFGGDVFSDAYGDKLLERYMPEDAVTSYGFHLAIWGGKWLNGLGSTVLTRTKLPLGYALQGLGYLAQFIGEFGEASVAIGGVEHKHFDRAHEALSDSAREIRSHLGPVGLDVYPAGDRQIVKNMESSFEWQGVDRRRFMARFGVIPSQ